MTNHLTKTLRAEKKFLKVIGALASFSILLFLIYAITAPRPKISEVFEQGPLGEKTSFYLSSDKTNLQPNEIATVDIMLDTCAAGASLCTTINAAEFLLSFDTSLLDPVDESGNSFFSYPQAEQLNRFVTKGFIFTNYFFPTSYMDPVTAGNANLLLTDGKVYIASINPAGYNSNETPGKFATLRFKAKASSGSTNVSIISPISDTDFGTRVSMVDGPIDINNQSLLANNGNLSLTFGTPSSVEHPASMTLSGPNNVTLNQSFNVALVIDTAGQPTTGFDAILNFDKDKLQVNSIQTYAGGPYQVYAVSNFNNSNGVITIGAYSAPNPGLTGQATVAVINFTPIALTGSTPISIKLNSLGDTTDSNISLYQSQPTTQPVDLLGTTNNLSMAIIVQQTASPSPSIAASPIPAETMSVKVHLEGLPDDQQDQKAEVYVPNTSFRKNVLLDSNGNGSLNLSGLNTSSTYDFVLWTHPYLTIKKNVNLANKPNPLDFGTAKIGELNTDDQINSLDWSWMKRNFGQSGD